MRGEAKGISLKTNSANNRKVPRVLLAAQPIALQSHVEIHQQRLHQPRGPKHSTTISGIFFGMEIGIESVVCRYYQQFLYNDFAVVDGSPL